MPSVEFWRPRLRGARFADGGIPLQVLSDLIALREMVIEVAKWRYLSENPDRQRVPRGFADKIDLKLASIGDGSAVPVINITTTDTILPGMELPYQEFLMMAKEDIARTVASASENGHAQTNGHIPNRFLAYFNRVGRSLRDDESLELPISNSTAPARLTKETRNRLLQRSAIIELTQVVTLHGMVPEADQQRMTFELQQVYGSRIAGPIPEQHREAIIKAFREYRNNTKILVHGIGRYDRQNRLSGMDAIEQVTLLDPLDVPARLDELRAMQDGWMDGDGKAPSMAGLDWLSINFERYFPDDLPLPHVYPTPEGGVEAEWSLGPHSIILEFHLDSHKGDWLRFAKEDDDDEDSQTLNLDDASAWELFIEKIRRLADEKVQG